MLAYLTIFVCVFIQALLTQIAAILVFLVIVPVAEGAWAEGKCSTLTQFVLIGSM